MFCRLGSEELRRPVAVTGLVEAGVDALGLGVDELGQGIGVGGAQLGEGSVVEDEPGEGVLIDEAFKGGLVGGVAVDGFALGGGFKPQFVEEQLGYLFWAAEVEGAFGQFLGPWLRFSFLR